MALVPESEERKKIYKNVHLNTVHGNNEKNLVYMRKIVHFEKSTKHI